MIPLQEIEKAVMPNLYWATEFIELNFSNIKLCDLNGVGSSSYGKYWFKNGLLHREDGPAIMSSRGAQFWYKNGELHREDGPAIIYVDGSKRWYRNGYKFNETSR